VPTFLPLAQDPLPAISLAGARAHLAAVLTPRVRRRSAGSRTVAVGIKVSAREARGLRVMARVLDLDSDTGAVLLRHYSLAAVMAMYDQYLAERRKSA
jgi:hypothetical protein